MQHALINKIIPMSAVDGPGNRFAIFLQGCNFNCLYCHNPETIELCLQCGRCTIVCPTKAISLDNKSSTINFNKEKCISCGECLDSCHIDSDPRPIVLSSENIIEQIKKVQHFISGVTVSGGECTLQADFLAELGEMVQDLGLTCFIDTNGSLPLTPQDPLIACTDKFMLDIKTVDNAEHLALTGKENKVVLDNLELLLSKEKIYELRTVIVPELLNNRITVDFISKKIGNTNVRYKLISYRKNGTRKIMRSYPEPTKEYMQELKELATKNGCKNVLIT